MRKKVEPVKFEILRDEIDMLVAGEPIKANIKDDVLAIGVDIDAEMDGIAAKINYWGGILAASRAEAEQLDALYRRFRGIQVNAILKGNGSLAEWKTKARIDASDGFLRHKNAKCLSIRNTDQLELIVKALFANVDLLRSRGAKKRDEINAQGMTTPSSSPGKTTELERAARTKRVRGKIKRKKKKTSKG